MERFDGRLKDGYFRISTNSNRRRFINNEGCFDCYCSLLNAIDRASDNICLVEPKINWQKSTNSLQIANQFVPTKIKYNSMQCQIHLSFISLFLSLSVCVCLHYTKSGSFITKSSDDRTWLRHTRFLSLFFLSLSVRMTTTKKVSNSLHSLCATDMFATKMKA